MSERERDKTGQVGAGREPAAQESAPGSMPQALVDRFGPMGALRFIQRRRQQGKAQAAARESTAAVQAAAREGISGAAGPLPHRDAIQKSFGRHDVSQVKAHADPAAAKGAAAMGAEAFATGDHVAFQGAPSLHTVAHEAAHVVQQRGGVQLKSGVGSDGDEHERQADAVADRVVAGESAEALLGGGEANDAKASSGVQRKLVGPEKKNIWASEIAARVADLPEGELRNKIHVLHSIDNEIEVRDFADLQRRVEAGEFDKLIEPHKDKMAGGGAKFDGDSEEPHGESGQHSGAASSALGADKDKDKDKDKTKDTGKDEAAAGGKGHQLDKEQLQRLNEVAEGFAKQIIAWNSDPKKSKQGLSVDRYRKSKEEFIKNKLKSGDTVEAAGASRVEAAYPGSTVWTSVWLGFRDGKNKPILGPQGELDYLAFSDDKESDKSPELVSAKIDGKKVHPPTDRKHFDAFYTIKIDGTQPQLSESLKQHYGDNKSFDQVHKLELHYSDGKGAAQEPMPLQQFREKVPRANMDPVPVKGIAPDDTKKGGTEFIELGIGQKELMDQVIAMVDAYLSRSGL